MNPLYTLHYTMRLSCISRSSIFLLFVFFLFTDATYYISSAPNKYSKGDSVPMKTLKLTSIPSALPYGFYEYHNHQLPFCTPLHFDYSDFTCNLGECLSGDKRQDSAYEIKTGANVTCQRLNQSVTVTCDHYHSDDYQNLRELIKYQYRAQITLDSLPIAEIFRKNKYEIGYPIGEMIDGQYILYNHLNFYVNYTGDLNKEGSSIYVVGFVVQPHSYAWANDSYACDFNLVGTSNPLNISGRSGDGRGILWTYSVTWVNSTQKWDNRWDQYFVVDEKLHWVSLSYAIIVAVALAIFLAVVLVKIMRSSVAKYSSFEDVEESGWKTLHGDVFRPPHHFMLLSVLVGSGAQLLSTSFAVLLLGAIGFLSPAQSGSLNQAIVVGYPMMGMVAGYSSARVYSRLGGGRKRMNAVLTALSFPAALFFMWFIADIILWAQHSSSGPVGVFFAVLGLWLGVHTPLVFLGAFFANRRPNGENPVGTNTIPRMVPPPPLYSHTLLLTPLLAILPFGVSFNELYWMMNALWSHHVYYFFGVVLVVFLLLTVIIAEVSVVLCYFSLANENYHWWWRAFYIPATVVVYIFLTAIFYVGVDLQLKTAASVFLYLSYTAIILLVFFVFMSSIAFYACWTFVHKIYSTLHVD